VCGISGIFSANGSIPEHSKVQLRAAANKQIHRGPDEQGFVDLPHFCAAHNRLSIIDLSTGQQPMVDGPTGNVIVFNGEIYNYIELRDELKSLGHSFVTTSDTEILLKSYAQYGTSMLERLNGMFAFAIYDARNKQLFAARDRFGEKPLYFFTVEERLYFASELTSLMAFQECGSAQSQASLMEYFACGYISGPSSLLENVRQLLPGEALQINGKGLHTFNYYTRPWRQDPRELSDDLIDSSLSRAIGMRLRADVPVATLLSGGVDSSLITLIAQRHSTQPLHSFSFGWRGEDDERPFAKEIAARAGTAHHEIELDRATFSTDIQSAIGFMDMPLADSAAFVVYELSKCIAQNGVKVVLSGDGGDELFGGYNWYRGTEGAKHLLKGVLRGERSLANDYVLGKFILDPEILWSAFSEAGVREFIERRTDQFASLGDTVNGRIAFDYQSYLPWMLMPKVDRMSMAHAVEIRAPLLDHTLVDSWSAVPGRRKIDGSTSKIRIKEYCTRKGLLTSEFLNRKKSGMNLPLSWWIRSNPAMFRDSVLKSGSTSVDLFGRARIEGWFEQIGAETTSGWTSSAQRIWTCFVYELWHSQMSTRRGASGILR
jgi:asparagine synthase (glutamine-hydrolysing)